MPALVELGLADNPSTDPIRYPGAPVRDSCLVTGSWLYGLTAQPGLPVGSWTLTIDGGPLAQVAAPDTELALDGVLDRLGLALVEHRHPVLAVGSNASPGQLAHKYGNSDAVSNVIPLTHTTVCGIDVGHAAHVGPAGYIPYAPRATDASVRRELFVLWLDDAQLARLHETERNYRPTLVSGARSLAVLDSGEPLKEYTLYRSRWGLLRATPDGAPIPATTQTEVLRLLANMTTADLAATTPHPPGTGGAWSSPGPTWKRPGPGTTNSTTEPDPGHHMNFQRSFTRHAARHHQLRR